MKAAFAFAVAASVTAGLFGAPEQAFAGPNLVTNGSFEMTSGVSNNGGYICSGTVAACGTASNVMGWTSTCNGSCGNGNSVGSVLFGGTGGSAFNGGIGLQTAAANSRDGGNFIGIDGDPTYTVSLSQNITGLTAGRSYLLSFYEAADTQAGNMSTTNSYWQVSLGGPSQNSQTQTSTGPNFFSGWSLQTLTFVATASSDVLTFMAKGTPAGVPPVSLLDGVSLTAAAVPEPAAWTLLVMGLVGVTVFRSRRSGRAI